jgi:phosphoribosylaminoimidazolecarboxamide formyltransferase/IMP cyclohydrolase
VPVKHSTPSGVGISHDGDLVEAFRRAKEGDALSIFGCTMAVSKKVDMPFVQEVSDILLECLVAPGFDDDAKEYITTKKKNIRLCDIGDLERLAQMQMEIIPVIGGFVVQQPFYTRINGIENLEPVSQRKPTPEEYSAMLAMWRICARVKSNSIVLGSSTQTYGIGTGQMSRVASARIAVYNANEVFGGGGKNKTVGSVGASDAFFPFPDGPELLARAGMRAIVYPLGSEKDKETIEVWNKYDVAAVCTRPMPGTVEIERCFAGHR